MNSATTTSVHNPLGATNGEVTLYRARVFKEEATQSQINFTAHSLPELYDFLENMGGKYRIYEYTKNKFEQIAIKNIIGSKNIMASITEPVEQNDLENLSSLTM